MGNAIGLNSQTSSEDLLYMRKGLTDVLYTAIGLSGTALAKTWRQKCLIYYVVSRDQLYWGGGTVGFNLCDMPWHPDTFEEDKAFFLSVLEDIRNMTGWETVRCSPCEDLLFECADHLARLLLPMRPEDINLRRVIDWIAETEPDEPMAQGFPLCPRHPILLGIWGCLACSTEA